MYSTNFRIINGTGDILMMQLDYADDGYYFFIVSFENKNFKAKANHSYFINDIKEYIKNINSLNLTSSDEQNIKIQDYDSDDYLMFRKTDNLGHFELKGLLGGSFRNYYLKFKFKIDQIDLTNLGEYFGRVIATSNKPLKNSQKT